jgi:acyl-CoA thioesterase-2
MPEVPGPDEGLTFAQIAEIRSGDKRSAAEFAKEWAALDTRYLGNSAHPGHTRLKEDTDRPARAQLWVRVNGELGDDPVLHIAAFTYASDLTLLGAALVPHDIEIGSPKLMPASLDHTIWFHRPFRADRWWLYDQWSPSASGSRGLSLARVFTEDGTLVATVAQEGLIRQRTR